MVDKNENVNRCGFRFATFYQPYGDIKRKRKQVSAMFFRFSFLVKLPNAVLATVVDQYNVML